MREDQFIVLPSQPSIYSVTKLGKYLVIGAGDSGKIVLHSSLMAVEQMILRNLNNDIDVIAVEAFQDEFPILGVAYIQKGPNNIEEMKSPMLTLFSTWCPKEFYNSSEPSSPSRTSPQPNNYARTAEILKEIELIDSHSKTFRLNYIPYHLYHVSVLRSNGSRGNVFLLSGSDNKIHTYESDFEKQSWMEVATKKAFPEFPDNFPSIITRMELKLLNEEDNSRISVCGCEDGRIFIYRVNEEGKTKATYNHYYSGMITVIKFYHEGPELNLTVASALSPTYIYKNILEDNFKVGTPLKFSSRWDSVETVCIADVDFDGRQEIILGTFGCTLLVYKYLDGIGGKGGWAIVAQKKFPSGILSIHFISFYLHVVTANGLHVIEYSSSSYAQKYGSLLTSSTISTENSNSTTDSQASAIETKVEVIEPKTSQEKLIDSLISKEESVEDIPFDKLLG